jgi:hypothetical protein
MPMAPPGEMTTYPRPSVGGFVSPPLGHACPDCGSTVFAITNRRVACLACSVSTRGSSLDPRTRLYPGEEVCGSADLIARTVALDRLVEPYRLPVPDVADVDEGDDAAPMDRSDESIDQYINRSDKSIPMNVSTFDRGDFERYEYPENRGGPNVGGPTGEIRSVVDPVKYDRDSKTFTKKSERDLADADRRRKKRPPRDRKYAEDATMFGPPETPRADTRPSGRVHPDE